MILAIRKKIENILANRDIARSRFNNDIFEAASAADAQDIIENYEMDVVEAVLNKITPELIATPEYVTLLAARNIIFGYTDKELNLDSLMFAVKDIAKEVKRLENLGIKNEVELFSKRTPDEMILSSAHLPDYYIDLLTSEERNSCHSYNYYYMKLLKVTKTRSAKEFLFWCYNNRFYIPSFNDRNYVQLTVHATSSNKDIWLGDADGHFVAKGTGKLRISIMPDVYVLNFGSLKNKSHKIELYKDHTYNEKLFER